MNGNKNINKDKGCTNAELRKMYPQNKENGGVIDQEKMVKDYSKKKQATYL